MTKLIAMAGKGGTGKTTFAALLIRGLLERGMGPVLAVDADPNATLPEALGIPTPTTIGMVREEFGALSGKLPAGMTKDVFFEMKLNEIVVEGKDLDLLVMGRPEGPGCYCYVNNLLRGAVERLSDNYPYVVVDNEAGLEHLSRRTTSRVDLMVVLSDHSIRGIRSAFRIMELAREMGLEIREHLVVVNRVPASDPDGAHGKVDEKVRREAEMLGLEISATIPGDPAVENADLERSGLLGLPPSATAARAVEKVLDQLERME